MTGMIWHWFTGYIISWGGVGALVAVIAWVLWFLTPAVLVTYKSELMYIAIAATVIAVTNTHSYTRGYNLGYATAINQVAAKNEAAKNAVDEATQSVDKCLAAGGTWDTTSGLCDR